MERNIKMLGSSKLKKEQLFNLVNFYETQLQLLDLIINDMSNVTLSTIQEWLEDTYNKAQEVNKTTNSFDEEHYTQLDLREFC